MSTKTSKIIWIVALSIVIVLLIVAIVASTSMSIGKKGTEELWLTDEYSSTDYVEGISKEGFSLSVEPQQ